MNLPHITGTFRVTLNIYLPLHFVLEWSLTDVEMKDWDCVVFATKRTVNH